MIIRKVVVFPDPLGPMNPYNDPRGTVRSRSSTATTPPNCFVTPRMLMASVMGPSSALVIR